MRADEKLTAFIELEAATRAVLCIIDCLIFLREDRLDPAASRTSGDFADSLAVFCGTLNA